MVGEIKNRPQTNVYTSFVKEKNSMCVCMYVLKKNVWKEIDQNVNNLVLEWAVLHFFLSAYI